VVTNSLDAKAGPVSFGAGGDVFKSVWELDPDCYTIDIVTGQRLVDVQEGDGFYL
jgi:hypothetical protein